jgi:hypothetical protein
MLARVLRESAGGRDSARKTQAQSWYSRDCIKALWCNRRTTYITLTLHGTITQIPIPNDDDVTFSEERLENSARFPTTQKKRTNFELGWLVLSAEERGRKSEALNL